MVKIRIIAVGKDKDRWITAGCDHYLKLLARYARVEIETVATVKATSLTPVQVKAKEAERLHRLISNDWLICLTDSGEKYDSQTFARRLDKWQTASGGRLCFAIGGPFGLDASIMDAAKARLSLSPLTFSHQLVRPVLLEQLYRAYSILHGTAYHK